MPDSPDNPVPDPEELPFEEALAALETVVREMESERISLEDLMSRYEQGTRLHHVCRKRLDEAQGRIEIIRQRGDGRSDVESFGGEDREEANSPESVSRAARSGDQKDETDTLSQDGELF